MAAFLLAAESVIERRVRYHSVSRLSTDGGGADRRRRGRTLANAVARCTPRTPGAPHRAARGGRAADPAGRRPGGPAGDRARHAAWAGPRRPRAGRRAGRRPGRAVRGRRCPREGRRPTRPLRAYLRAGVAAPRDRRRAEAREHLQRPAAVGRAAGGASDATTASWPARAPPPRATLRAALRGIGTARRRRRAMSSFMLMAHRRGRIWATSGLLVFADCGVNPDPTAARAGRDRAPDRRRARATFLHGTAARRAPLVLDPRQRRPPALAQGGGGGAHRARARAPELLCDGELQVDAALVPEVAASKAPGSAVGGPRERARLPRPRRRQHRLQAGGADRGRARGGPDPAGPRPSPANDLSRGCSVDDIVDVIAVTRACRPARHAD